MLVQNDNELRRTTMLLGRCALIDRFMQDYTCFVSTHVGLMAYTYTMYALYYKQLLDGDTFELF